MATQLAVIVLNYGNYQDTIDCVRSLLNQDYSSLHIVIVENGSKNESLKILKEHFAPISNITIIENKENLGFARGNNVGILYAKNKLMCQYVFVLNNDTVLTKNKILSQMMNEYPPDIALVSPTLGGLQGEIQHGHNWNKVKMIRNTISAVMYTCFDLIPMKMRGKLIFIKRAIRPKKDENRYFEYRYDNNNYQIQGAAFLLTPAFFKHYKILYPRTFLYCEEINMSWYLKKANLSTMVIETDIILHKEAQSTSAFLSDKKIQMKAKFAMRSFIKSFPLYLSSYSRIIGKYSRNVD